MRLLHPRRAHTAAAVSRETGFAVLDLETTGLSPRTDRIVEVAVVRLDLSGSVVSEFCTLVNPGRDIGPTRIHGVRASDVATAPRFAEIAGLLLSELAGHLPVGHNVRFDLRFLDAELGRLGAGLPHELGGLCTMRLARSYLDGHAGRTLTACCQAAGVPVFHAHQALADARAAAGLLGVYRRCHASLPEDWAVEVRQAAVAVWPSLPTTTIQPVTRQLAARRQAAQLDYLAQLVRRLPTTSTGNADLDAYLAVLDQALEDRHLDPSEAEALQDAAMALDISGPALAQAHRDYLAALAKTALADGIVSDAELGDLTDVARLLGLRDHDVTEALEHAQQQRPPATLRPEGGERLLRVGMRVCFTGQMCLDRAELEQRTNAPCRPKRAEPVRSAPASWLNRSSFPFWSGWTQRETVSIGCWRHCPAPSALDGHGSGLLAAMTAIWSNDGERWALLTPSGFPDEASLHSLIEQSPQLLPLAGSPRLTIVGREVRLGSGSADLIAVQPNGRLVVIEVKLANNAEARRAVVAQVLTYAAYLHGVERADLSG